MVNNMFVRANTTFEHDLERMTAKKMMFNSGGEWWSWRSSRKRPCAVDHATCLVQLALVKLPNLARLQHVGRHSEDECSPNLSDKVKTSRWRTSRRRTHNDGHAPKWLSDKHVPSKNWYRIQNFGMRFIASNLLARLLTRFASRVCAVETNDCCVVITPTCFSERTLFNISRCASVHMTNKMCGR